MKTVKKITLLVIAAAVVLGCIFAAGCTDDSTTASPALTISVDKQGGFVYGIGDEFTIELPSNPSTGYMWVVTQADGLNYKENEVMAESTGMVGAPTTQSFTFSGQTEGVFPFVLSYVKSGEDAGIYVYSDYLIVKKDAEKNTGYFKFIGTYVPSVGDIVTVQVPDIGASTGYVWTVTTTDAENFELIGSEVLPANTDAVGAPGLQVWTFKANQPGTYNVIATQEKKTDAGVEHGAGFFVPVTIQAIIA